MKTLIVSMALVMIASLCVCQNDCNDFQILYEQAQKDFPDFRGEVETGLAGLGQSFTNIEYTFNPFNAQEIELYKGISNYFTLDMTFSEFETVEEASAFMKKMMKQILACYPEECELLKYEDFDPEEPCYSIVAVADGQEVVEYEQYAKYPVINFEREDNWVTIEITGVVIE